MTAALYAPRLGLALGSGSARGLAHIGVLRAIEEAGIKVSVVAGTSIGALVGAVHAADQLGSLSETFRSLDWRGIAGMLDVVLPRSGLIDGARISDFIRRHVPAADIKSLAHPFAAVAADLVTGEEVVITSGDVIEAVRASISIPGILTPARRDGRLLVDGGVVNPVPVSAARRLGADRVIAVDLNHGAIGTQALKPRSRSPRPEIRLPDWIQGIGQGVQDLSARLLAGDLAAEARTSRWPARSEPMPSIFEVVLASINIMEARITEARLALDQPELVIRPPLGHIHFMGFDRAEEIIETGYRSAQAALEEWRPD